MLVPWRPASCLPRRSPWRFLDCRLGAGSHPLPRRPGAYLRPSAHRLLSLASWLYGPTLRLHLALCVSPAAWPRTFWVRRPYDGRPFQFCVFPLSPASVPLPFPLVPSLGAPLPPPHFSCFTSV